MVLQHNCSVILCTVKEEKEGETAKEVKPPVNAITAVETAKEVEPQVNAITANDDASIQKKRQTAKEVAVKNALR